MSNPKLTQVERTILANQFKILANFEDQESNLKNAEILEYGYTGLYHNVLLSNETIELDVCKETTNILQMYRVIRNSVAALSAQDQAELNIDKIKFDGFDNHEPHFHYATFLIDRMNLWEEHKEKYIDSHTGASIIKYRKMLETYNANYGAPNYELSKGVLQQMIDTV